MKRLALMLCTLALLTACGEEPLDWTPTPATPQPTPTPSAETEAPWAALTVDDLPTALAEPDDLFSGEEPQVYLLGCKLEEGIYLYGLNEGYGGGVLLRRGEDLAHFDQSFSPSESPALPELYLSDFDGNGVEELAVRYLMESQGERISYDLHLYAWEGGLCSDRPITHGDCAQKALEAVETEYDAATGRFTLSYGNTSAVCQTSTAPPQAASRWTPVSSGSGTGSLPWCWAPGWTRPAPSLPTYWLTSTSLRRTSSCGAFGWNPPPWSEITPGKEAGTWTTPGWAPCRCARCCCAWPGP